MPSLSGSLASLADKAQSAINATPLAGHLPSISQDRHDAASSPPPSDAQGDYKSHTMESIQHYLRTLGQQYSATSPVQKIITAEKGVAIDFDGLSRDTKAQSKELYTWGQAEADDIRDVTDRLAWLNFIHGSLTATLAKKLDAARAPLKALRDAELALAPRRNNRAGLYNQIQQIEHAQQKGSEARLRELKQQLGKIEAEDDAQEKEIMLLKRKAIRESEHARWEALREYGDKLALVSQAAEPIVAALPTLPPSPELPYRGAQDTGSVRAALQHALDNYKPGDTTLFPSDLTRSDTRTFGESHADELQKIVSPPHGQPGLPITPPAVAIPLPAPAPAPATFPTPSTAAPAPAPATFPTPAPTATTAALNAPAFGSMPAPAAKHETAEEEKKRLRLEREEREKILHTPSTAPSGKEEELPPYQEP